MPSKDEVRAAVCGFLSGFTGIPVTSIQDEWELKGAPLRFDDNRLAYLAMSLRGYVKDLKSTSTVTASEIRKSGLTVGGLTDLVHGKVK